MYQFLKLNSMKRRCKPKKWLHLQNFTPQILPNLDKFTKFYTHEIKYHGIINPFTSLQNSEINFNFEVAPQKYCSTK